MQLADPSLLKSQCLVDGAWVGEGIDAIRNPANGAHDRQGPPLRRGGGDPRHRSGGEGLRAVGEVAAEAARGCLTPMVRSDHRQSRRYRPDHDQRAGQAPRRSARRDRLRRRLHRVLRRGGQARLRRDQPDLPRRFAHSRLSPADRRRRGDHALELPRRDDHPQGGAGAGRRLHGGGQARARDAADGAGARRAGRSAPACPPASSTS